ncbi:MAG TPA: hypothetical protein VEX88_08665 [Glaciibacter sp.]|nr:hypothetical protein [Glaciibacter sp.]
MDLEEQRSATPSLAIMTGCLLLVVWCNAAASRGWALLISFDGQPSDTAGEGLRILALTAAALAVVALLEGFLARSWWSAGILAVHAALTLAHPNLWLITALPTVIALLVIILRRLLDFRRVVT